MKIAALLLILLLCFALDSFPTLAQTKSLIVPDAEMMSVGVYYYPEAWSPDQWERDIKNIKNFGFEFIHMGEFAWAMMEPEENKFDFAWLDRAVELATRENLKIILCTPSPTPPVWLVRKHPEVLIVSAEGVQMQHGSRAHASWSSDVYRRYVERVNTELAKRYGNNKNVWGWQIDNELSHYSKQFDYSDAAQARFREWLKAKYKTIENLNRDWGTSFWSQRYQNFEQIRIPNQVELVQKVNPHALLDFQRFFADLAADYIRFQTVTLRRYARNQWITTNFMSLYPWTVPALSAKDLDVFTWTVYPVHGQLNVGERTWRMGQGYRIAFMHDQMRAFNGRQGIMELQPSQVNWGAANPLPQPGAVRMWILQAFGSGAKFVCTYRYRQPLAGSELYHKAIVEPDGVTLSPGGAEYVQAIKDINALRRSKPANPQIPAKYQARRTAFVFSHESRWDSTNHPQNNRWDALAHWLRYYNALKSFGAPVDVIDESRDFSEYPFLVVPAQQLVDEKHVARWRKYVENGGHLILTARTGHKDRRGQLWQDKWAAPILDLIGAEIKSYDNFPAQLTGKVGIGDKIFDWATWGEQLQPRDGTTVLAVYADQFYARTPAAVTRKLGKGTVTYIGVDSLGGEFEKNILLDVFDRANVATENFDEQFQVEWRDGFWTATNFTDKMQFAPAAPNARILIGTREIAPGGATIWTE